MPAGAAATSGFETFVSYAGVILQLFYYLVIPSMAIFAAIQFKRFVDFKIDSAPRGIAPKVEKQDTEVKVEEFVD
jgi:hypothetical protein